MNFLGVLLMAAVQSGTASPCVGDFIHQGENNEGIGVRVRADLDIAEIKYSDYSEITSRDIVFDGNTAVIHDWDSKTDYILICEGDTAVLITPTFEHSSSEKYNFRRVKGDLWDVGMKEGWLTPEDS